MGYFNGPMLSITMLLFPLKRVKVNRRKTTSREEKLTIGSAKRRKTGKIIDLGRNHKLTRP
jgi:hypothetical protein